jgi:hypothetical protein
MHCTEIREHIFHLQFSDQRSMSSTFLRFQEFYENPEFRGKIFSREEFTTWYTREQGTFTYLDEWEGHNIPSETLIPFYEGQFDPLSEEERQLLQLFKGKSHPFYIIASFGNDTATDDHELAHGFYTVRQSYKAEVSALLGQYDTSVLEQYLAFRKCYHRAVWEDEKQAFLATDLSSLTQRGFAVESLALAHDAFKHIFQRHKAYFAEADMFRG